MRWSWAQAWLDNKEKHQAIKAHAGSTTLGFTVKEILREITWPPSTLANLPGFYTIVMHSGGIFSRFGGISSMFGGVPWIGFVCVQACRHPPTQNFCILACRTHCNRGNGKVQMVRNESPETWILYTVFNIVGCIALHCIAFTGNNHPSLSPKHALSTMVENGQLSFFLIYIPSPQDCVTQT